MARRRQTWLLTAGGVLAALVITEAALRVLDLPRAIESFRFLGPELGLTDIFVEDGELFWRMRADAASRDANRFGFRGPWPDGPAADGELRIACIGDSCTFGVGVRIEETYGWVLKRALQRERPDLRVRTVLGALPGYSTHQSRTLYDRYVAPLEPDVTVLYVGAWNDLIPAIGANDRERTARATSIRLLRAARRLLGVGQPTADRDTYIAEFEAGHPREGRRVPPPHYRDNLRALIQCAQSIDSFVVVLLPPVPVSRTAKLPIMLDYRAATRETAAEFGVPVVDGPALFDAFVRNAPAGWRGGDGQPAACFHDWIHPSALGHRILAEALREILAHEIARTPRPGPGPRITSVAPDKTAFGRASAVEIECQGVPAGADCEVWIGSRWARPLVRLTATRWRATVPATLPPGMHAVELNAPNGLATGPALTVEPIELQATMTRTDSDSAELTLSTRGAPGHLVAVWLSASRRATPIATRFGPFELDSSPSGRPAARTDLPFRFGDLPLPHLSGEVATDGRWHAVERIPLSGPDLPSTVWLQGLHTDPDAPQDGAVTAVVEVAVPR